MFTNGDMEAAENYLARSAVLSGFRETAHLCGIDANVLIRAQGLPTSCLDMTDLRIPVADVIQLLESAAEQSQRPDFGLTMATRRTGTVLGLVGLALNQEATLEAALQRLVDYMWLQTGGLLVKITRRERLSLVALAFSAKLPQSTTQAIELAMASLVTIISRLLGTTWHPEIVSFAHPNASRSSLYSKVFGQQPIFSSQQNMLVLQTADLDRTLPGNDPQLASLLYDVLESRVGKAGTSRAERIGHLVQLLLPQQRCRVEHVARLLGVDRRTVARWLRDEGTTFSQLVHSTRQELSDAYVAGGTRTLTEIAELLGFASLSSYARWRLHHRQRNEKAATGNKI